MKKFLKLSIILFLLTISLGSISGCGDEKEPTQTTAHTHTYGNKWLTSPDGHYKECTCHPDVKELQAHLDGSDKDGLCDLCSFIMKEKQQYTITLLDSDGNPVKDATLRISTTTSSIDKTTNERGDVTIEFVYIENITVVVLNLPEGYSLSKVKSYKLTQSHLVINDINKN